jgi:hypothetical protein
MLGFSIEYRRLGDFTYHALSDPQNIKSYLMKWILREWEVDHNEAPDEPWTVTWMGVLPNMEFTLEAIRLAAICPNAELMRAEEFRRSLKERADEREESILRGISIEPLLINSDGFELMDGYTRYTVLKNIRASRSLCLYGLASTAVPGGWSSCFRFMN